MTGSVLGVTSAQWALQQGYDVIRFASVQVQGGVNWVIINQDKINEIVKGIEVKK